MLHFPAKASRISQQAAHSIDVRNCESTEPGDKRLILGKIAEKSQKYNSRVSDLLRRSVLGRWDAALRDVPFAPLFLLLVVLYLASRQLALGFLLGIGAYFCCHLL